MIYYYIKITDNKNPHYFFIDLTTQRNYKNRICGLRSKAVDFYHNGVGPHRDIYNIFTKDYSCYKIHTAEFPNYKEAKSFTQVMFDKYMDKLR